MFLKRNIWKDWSINFYELDKINKQPSHYFIDYQITLEPSYYKYFESYVDESFYEGHNIYLDENYCSKHKDIIENDVNLYYCDISI